MAIPVVSGAVADLLQAKPSLTPDQVKALLMLTAYKAFPTSSMVTDGGENYVSYYDIFTVGAGYLDLKRHWPPSIRRPPKATQCRPSQLTQRRCHHQLRSFLRLGAIARYGEPDWPGARCVWGARSVWGAGGGLAPESITVLGEQSVIVKSHLNRSRTVLPMVPERLVYPHI
jgi:subtilase family protein